MSVSRVEQKCGLRTMGEVLERYGMDGPHATIVCDIPTPGNSVSQRSAVIGAAVAELEHRDVPARTIENIREVLENLEPRGTTALVSGNDHDAAFHWLSPESVPPSRLSIGPLPSLLPVVAELQRSGAVVGALIDRVGADVFLAERGRVERVGVVAGDEESVVRGAPGASSPRRFTHRVEAALDANADEIATSIRRWAASNEARAIVLSGDDRMVRRVSDLLTASAGQAKIPVSRVKAGGRHEPNAPDRLGHAAVEALRASVEDHSSRMIARLSEELGQHDKAVVGVEGVWNALAEGRAELVLISAEAPQRREIEEITKKALATNTKLVALVGDGPVVALDGVASLLRY